MGSGRYGLRKLARMGIVVSDDAVSDNTATTIAEMGGLVIDINDGEAFIIDSSTKTQRLTY